MNQQRPFVSFWNIGLYNLPEGRGADGLKRATAFEARSLFLRACVFRYLSGEIAYGFTCLGCVLLVRFFECTVKTQAMTAASPYTGAFFAMVLSNPIGPRPVKLRICDATIKEPDAL